MIAAQWRVAGTMASNRIPVNERLSIGEEEIEESFIRSGGAAYCMTLRLDQRSQSSPAILAAE